MVTVAFFCLNFLLNLPEVVPKRFPNPDLKCFAYICIYNDFLKIGLFTVYVDYRGIQSGISQKQ
jgi:hypothetical protein